MTPRPTKTAPAPGKGSRNRPAVPRKGGKEAADAPRAGTSSPPAPKRRPAGSGTPPEGSAGVGRTVPPTGGAPGAGRGHSAPALRVEYVAVGDLVPAAYNPRRISPESFDRLKRGIETFGLVDPIVARRRDRLVIGGHQRLDAAKALGIATVPVVFLDDLDDQRTAALNVLLNNPAAQGEWDTARLTDLLSTLDAEGFDATLTGFDESALAKLLGQDAPLTFPAFDEAIATEHECPKCGYRWSGSTAPSGANGAEAVSVDDA